MSGSFATNFATFVWPETSTDGPMDISVKLWRSVGFRRVGTSEWFAFTPNPDHPSQRLDASQDYDFPEPPLDHRTMPDHKRALFESLYDHESLDGDCLDHLRATLPDPEDPGFRSPKTATYFPTPPVLHLNPSLSIISSLINMF